MRTNRRRCIVADALSYFTSLDLVDVCLVGAFSVITNLRIELFEALVLIVWDRVVLCLLAAVLHAVATEPEQCHLPCVPCCNPAHYNTGTGKC